MANKGINKVILVGNLGNDPEVRYTPSGAAVTRISVATSESWKDKNSGQMQEKTEWHNVTFFGKLAEIAGDYLKKGSQIYVEGKLKTDKYQDKETGQDRYSTGIVVDSFTGVLQMLGAKPEPVVNINNGPITPKPNKPVPDSASQAPQNQGFNDSFDDDLPF